MNTILRFASFGAVLAGMGFFVTGCECTEQEQSAEPGENNSNQQTVTECESLKKFVGTSRSSSLAYTDGADLVVDGVNGNIEVNIGSGTDVTVEFQPFSWRGHSKEADAKADIENDLVTTFTDDGSMHVVVSRKDGSFNGLGADIVITLPSGFNGGVDIDPNNGFVEANLGGLAEFVTIKNDGSGDIDVTGASGPLNLVGEFDITVAVSEWSATDGSVKSNGGLGNVTITVPSGANGSIQATSQGGLVISPSPLPADWSEDAAGDNSKTFTFGTVDGGNLVVDGGDDVTILVD
jgi:hypothetical protein